MMIGGRMIQRPKAASHVRDALPSAFEVKMGDIIADRYRVDGTGFDLHMVVHAMGLWRVEVEHLGEVSKELTREIESFVRMMPLDEKVIVAVANRLKDVWKAVGLGEALGQSPSEAVAECERALAEALAHG